MPFSANTPAAVFAKHLTEDLPLLHEMKKEFSEPTARLIKKMMAKDRNSRHASPRQLIEDVQRVILDIHKQPVAVERAGAAPRPRKKNSRWAAMALGGAAAIIIVIAAVMLLKQKQQPPDGTSPGNTVIEKPDDKQNGPKPTDPTDPKAVAEAEADKALKQAEAFEKSRPAAFNEIIATYQAVVDKHAGTTAAQVAGKRQKLATDRRTRAAGSAVQEALADVEDLLRNERYGAAIRRWESMQGSSKALGITEKIEDEVSKLKDEAAKALGEKSARADKLLAGKQFDQARSVYQSVVDNFGLAQAEQKARNALAKIDELEKQYAATRLAEEQRADECRARIYDLNASVATMQFDDVRKAYQELKKDCPETLLPFIEERENDLALLAGLRKAIVEHLNGGSSKIRKVVLRKGRTITVAAITASETGVALKVTEDMEMSKRWGELAVGTLNDFAAAAVPEEHLLLALLAHYTGMDEIAERRLGAAARKAALRKQAARLQERFNFAARFNHAREIRRLIAEVQPLVEGKEAEKAGMALKKLEKKIADSGLGQEFGPQVAKLVGENNETLAKARLQKAVDESERGNWKAVGVIIRALKDDLSDTKTVKVTEAALIARLLAQCETLTIDRDMLTAINHFIRMEDGPARALFVKIAREKKGPLGEDAKAFLDALKLNVNLPPGASAPLLDSFGKIPDPWERVWAFRTFHKRSPGSYLEARARIQIGSIFRNPAHLNRPVWAREVFLSVIKDFRKYDDYVAEGHIRLGLSEEACGNWREAEKNYDAVVKKFPDRQVDCAWAMKAKANHYNSTGETEKAVPILEGIVADYPLGGDYTSSAQFMLAVLYRDKLGKPKAALKAFTQVYFRTPEHTYFAPCAMLAASDLLAQEDGRKAEAKELLYRVIKDFAETQYAAEARKKLQEF